MQANHEMIPQCLVDGDAMVEEDAHLLGDKPVVDLDTPGSAGLELQNTSVHDGEREIELAQGTLDRKL